MTREPMIACLMPCYNRMPRFHYLLAEAVESFLRQDYENKELVILNDTPGQTLSFDHPKVRVINAATRFAFVSDKIDYMINATQADVFCRWDDDDINLPHRLSYCMAKLGGQLQWRAGNYWYSPDGTLREVHHAGNTSIQAILRREAITRIGGYPKGVSMGDDQVFDARLAQAGIRTGLGEIVPKAEIYYIYRWGTGSTHLSGKDGGASTNAHYEEIGRQPILPGDFVIQPKWLRDYAADANAAAQQETIALGPSHRANRSSVAQTPRSPGSGLRPDLARRDTADVMVHSLAGVWRDLPPPEPLVVAELAEHADRLLEAGVGSLVWRRLALANANGRDGLRALKHAYRLDTLRAARHEEQIADLFDRLGARGIDAVLCKGWSVARIYPETGLRPYSDIDLAIAPGQLSDAAGMLQETPGKGTQVDLHGSVPDLKTGDWDGVMLRSRVVPLGESRVRMLGREDQLRQLCLHFWRHLGCRPLWLCDIGAALEAAGPTFDWDYCLRGKPAVADTILCVLGLATELLKAQAPREIAGRAGRLPGWLVGAVLWRWSNGMVVGPLWSGSRDWNELRQALLFGKFNPMRAAERMRLSPHQSLLAIQAASLCGRPVQYGVRLWRVLARKLSPRSDQAFDLHEDRVF
jgi:hypothetical protein